MSRHSKRARIYLIGALFVAVTLALWTRLVHVQLLDREYYRLEASKQHKKPVAVPPVRGGIFDRNGRPLALSIRSCSVAVRPGAIARADRVVDLLSRHLSVPRSEIRRKLRSDRSFVWVKRQCTLSESVREELRSLRGVEVHREADRVYPFETTAAKVVGFVGHDSKGMAGVEATFDDDLSGTPGWEVVQRDGRYRSSGYHTYARKQPVNGKHVILTIDAVLQEIAEAELRDAVHTTAADRGALVVMDCRTGEILALAEEPAPPSREGRALADSLWTLRSISCVYEPGSTFKLVTAAALLEMDRVKTYDVYDAEEGRADLGVAVISDAHPHGHLTFREGFIYSSNIVMAKAATSLSETAFYEFVKLFGFGVKTEVGLMGESPGFVPPVEKWSDRTQITMAFGQEIAVTPLQMANAFAAVANNGVLMTPTLVQSIVDDQTGRTERVQPLRVRRVVSEETARRLREFCRAVVSDGTGKNAQSAMFEVAGKTGTAEKASPGGGYLRDQFIASFVGFAPYDEPRVVCLVLLDEPGYYYRFGGVSAAPVFARINQAIANTTDLFDDALSRNVVGDDAAVEAGIYRAPNFLRLSHSRAMARARELGLNVLCKGERGEVVSQDPDPGVAMQRDQVVRLVLRAVDNRDRSVPNVRGLPMREAKRRLVAAGFTCEVLGSGIVSSQTLLTGQRDIPIVRIECVTRDPGKTVRS